MLTLTSQGAQFLMQSVSTVVLARLLTPADFGLVAMVTAITGLGQAFRGPRPFGGDHPAAGDQPPSSQYLVLDQCRYRADTHATHGSSGPCVGLVLSGTAA